MKLFNVIALGALLLTVPFGAGCGVSKVCVTDGGMAGAGGGGAGVGGGGGLGGAAAIEFTDFVNDLILNKTSSITQPETINDKTFKDSMSPTAFDPLFQ
jgi:hypothetical protein